MSRRALIAGTAALTLLVVPEASSLDADRKPPKISEAVMVDKDEDGFADRVVLTYTEKVTHRADDDGTYPFRVVGYKITRIGRAGNVRELTLFLVERIKTDPAAEPNILYDRGRSEAVYDGAQNEARTQTFKATKAFVAVPEGSSLLIVNVEGPGTVSTQDGSFACATSCYTIVGGSLVLTLEAVADEGSSFEGWSGSCAETGTLSPCILVMDSNKWVGASFS